MRDGMTPRMKTVFTTETEAGRLALARRAAGYKSAAAAARALKVSEVTYRTHETGARGYDLETALDYGRLFNADPHYLKFGKGEAPKTGYMRIPISALTAMLAEGVRLARLSPSLDPEYLAGIVLEALSEYVTDGEETDPAQFARLRLRFLKSKSGAE